MWFCRQPKGLLQEEFYLFLFQMGPDGETHIRVGKLNMVDLAGSERQAKTGAAVSRSIFREEKCERMTGP